MLAAAEASAASALSVSSFEATPPPSRSLEEFQALGERVGVPPGDGQFFVEFEQFEVGRGHVGHERQHHAALRFLGREELRARGLVEPAHAAPEVQFPEGVRGDERVGAALAAGIGLAEELDSAR